MKPKIAITGPTTGGGPAYFFTALQVRLAGGRPVRLHPEMNWQQARFDGLLLGGGADITPRHYESAHLDDVKTDSGTGEPVVKKYFDFLLAFFVYLARYLFSYSSSRGKTDPKRDIMEMSLLGQAIQAGAPVLGICRGMQLINIYHSGTLNRELKDFYFESPQVRTVFPKKRVEVKEASQLCKILKRRYVRVNALHDQAIAKLGKELVVSSKEGNGIIQAIEHERRQRRIIGVQWHPEFLVFRQSARRLFQWVVHESTTHPTPSQTASKTPVSVEL